MASEVEVPIPSLFGHLAVRQPAQVDPLRRRGVEPLFLTRLNSEPLHVTNRVRYRCGCRVAVHVPGWVNEKPMLAVLDELLRIRTEEAADVRGLITSMALLPGATDSNFVPAELVVNQASCDGWELADGGYAVRAAVTDHGWTVVEARPAAHGGIIPVDLHPARRRRTNALPSQECK